MHELAIDCKGSWDVYLRNEKLRLAFRLYQNQRGCIPSSYLGHLRDFSLASLQKLFLVWMGIDHERNRPHVFRASLVSSATFQAGGKSRFKLRVIN
ncbi:hypothetical protein RD1_1468 [Roseobacter denitrificans OCh 114]|uniref:Uncharacterized protein n=1 Tax=Roseobacter denitrificans (strain ATCC 33942 / OCh 114) TaxID=375451 RepID=Q16A91_ROSDO|nr:hypothetical protein RD1_1468 [Roseobacter denitrificans OCh 114]